MRLREKVAQQLLLRRKHTGRIMEDYAFLCIYASRRNALNSADEHAQTSAAEHGDCHSPSARRAQTAQMQHAGLLGWTRSRLPPASVFPGCSTEGLCPRRRVRRAHIWTPSRHRGPGPGTWKDPDPRRRSSRGSGAQNRPACAAAAATRCLRPVPSQRFLALWSQAY